MFEANATATSTMTYKSIVKIQETGDRSQKPRANSQQLKANSQELLNITTFNLKTLKTSTCL